MGRRVDLAALASEGVLDAPVPVVLERLEPTRVRVGLVAANPVNPRASLGDLDDLESMRTVGQLQPCAVVTRGAFLAIYPDQGEAIGTAEYVVVAGSRRRAAAERFGLAELEIRVLDRLAGDRGQFYAASVTENIDRRNFDPLEEAHAIEQLIKELGSGARAAEVLERSTGWISQRLGLLRLSADMQGLLRTEVLSIRDARRLSLLPAQEQLAAWQAEQRPEPVAGADGFTAVNPSDGTPSDRPAKGGDRRRRISFDADDPGTDIAALLRSRLSPEQLQVVIASLTSP